MTVTVLHGTGTWAYWLNPAERQVIADSIYQPTAPNFAGRLNCVGTPGMQAELAESDFAVPERPDPSVFSDAFPTRLTIPKEK